jgi:hypothetical protein
MARIRRQSFAPVVLLIAAACAGDGRAVDSLRADSAARTAATPARERSGPATDAGANGLWTVASLEKRLDLQGMVPRRRPDPVQHPFLTIPGTVYQLGNADLQVFIYESAAALARDISKLDTTAVAPIGAPVQWPTKATLITNSNLAAILLSDNALQIERVQKALMAGTGSTVFDPAASPPR